MQAGNVSGGGEKKPELDPDEAIPLPAKILWSSVVVGLIVWILWFAR